MALKKYLIYLRKSRQDNENETVEEVLARHERQLQEYALREFGYRISEKDIYREVVSGETIDDRPQIKAMFERMQAEDIAGVLVIESSRLTRGDLLDCGTVVHLFRYTDTLIMTPQKTYNLADKYDRKFFEMELTKGNDYLEYTKEILERGRYASAMEGNFVASTPPYGYDAIKINKSPTLAINESEAQYVRLVFEMYASGHGATSIAKKLNDLGAKPRKAKLWRETAIRQILENPVYIGKIRYRFKATKKVYENGKLTKKRPRDYNCELVDGKHDAIISEELFNKCKEQKNRMTRERTSSELSNAFAGLIKCKRCGKAIGYHPVTQNGGRTRKHRYVCTSKIYCDNKSADVDDVNNIIIKALKTHISDFETKAIKDTNDIVKTQENLKLSLEKELEKLENKQEDLYDLLESGIYTKEVFLMRNEKLASERERLKTAIGNIVIPEAVDYKEKTLRLHQAIDMIQDDTIKAKVKNDFLKEIIDVIYYERAKDDKDYSGVSLEIVLR